MKNEIPLFYAGEEELKSKSEQIPVFSCKFHKKERIKKRTYEVKKKIGSGGRAWFSLPSLFGFFHLLSIRIKTCVSQNRFLREKLC